MFIYVIGIHLRILVSTRISCGAGSVNHSGALRPFSVVDVLWMVVCPFVSFRLTSVLHAL